MKDGTGLIEHGWGYLKQAFGPSGHVPAYLLPFQVKEAIDVNI